MTVAAAEETRVGKKTLFPLLDPLLATLAYLNSMRHELERHFSSENLQVLVLRQKMLI